MNPLWEVTVTVERPGEPALIGTASGLAVTAKSCTVTVTTVEWDSVALVPVRVPVNATVYVPANPEQVKLEDTSVALLVSTRLLVPRAQFKPEGEVDCEIPIVPVSPLIDAIETVDVVLVPAIAEMSAGAADMLKSCTETFTVRECERPLPVPAPEAVTVTVYALALPVQDRIEEPEVVPLDSEIDATLRLHVRPFIGEIDAESPIAPANPFWPVIVRVAVPDACATIVNVPLLVEIVKSWTMIVTVLECERDPLIPVTVSE